MRHETDFEFSEYCQIPKQRAELTFRSVENILSSHCDGLTISVVSSSDGVAFVTRSVLVDDMTNGKGFVSYHSSKELEELKLPSLRDVIRAFEKYKSKVKKQTLHIEMISVGMFESLHQQLSEAIQNQEISLGEILISSFNHPDLISFSKRMPGITLGVSVMGVPHDFAQCIKSTGASVLLLENDGVDPKMIADAKIFGVPTLVRGAKKEEHTFRISDMGARGVIYA
jgi:glycerophosphoryl diester phosphodiesterase